MSSFSSLMSSLQSGRPADNPTPTVRAPVPPTAAQKTAQRPVASASTNTNGVKRSAEGVSSAPTSTNGNKRKADSTAAAPPNKSVKLTAPTRDERPIAKAIEKRPPTQQTAAQAYRGTMKAAGNPATQKDTKPVSRPTQPVQAHAPAAAPVKRGFAALMAKATAAQETVKAKGVDTIKHKPTELVKKKDRQRMKQEAKEREKSGKVQHRSAVLKDASGTRIVGVGQKPRRPKTDLGYSGTMRGKSDSVSAQKNPKTKGMGQDKHGGYASWSDLDDAEDDEEGYYESESDMEEAGFDDMMEEELQATKIARQEDQREQAEEERLRREKLERKKRLMALSSSAAASKKRY